MRSIAQLMSLKGRVAVITGGAGHIGRAIAEALGEAGASLVLVDLPGGRSQEAANELSSRLGVDAIPCDVDLADFDQVRRIPSRVLERFGRLDVLVHCAALVGTSALEGWAVPFADQSADTFRKALDVNLGSAFVLTQAAAPALAAHGTGSVVCVGSIYAVSGPDWRLYDGTTLGNPAAYAASKGGLVQLGRWLATTMAPRVRVNTLSPGGVYRGTPEPFLSRYVERTPLGRMATEEDLKGAALFLASDLSAYVTGQHLLVDGGWTVW